MGLILFFYTNKGRPERNQNTINNLSRQVFTHLAKLKLRNIFLFQKHLLFNLIKYYVQSYKFKNMTHLIFHKQNVGFLLIKQQQTKIKSFTVPTLLKVSLGSDRKYYPNLGLLIKLPSVYGSNNGFGN